MDREELRHAPPIQGRCPPLGLGPRAAWLSCEWTLVRVPSDTGMSAQPRLCPVRCPVSCVAVAVAGGCPG